MRDPNTLSWSSMGKLIKEIYAIDMVIKGLTQPMHDGSVSCWAVAWIISTGPPIGGDGPRTVQPKKISSR
jgi:hypothetical protein